MTAMMIEAALRGLLFAVVVGAGLSLMRVKHVPARKVAWSLVLVASLAMPFLMRWPLLTGLRGRLAWVAPIWMSGTIAPAVNTGTVAAQPEAAVPEATVMPTETVRAEKKTVVPAVVSASPTVDASAMVEPESAAPAPVRKFAWPPVERMVVWIYLAVGGALLVRLLFGLGAALRLWATAEPVSPLVAPDGNVRASARIASPVTVGSGIVLPGDYEQWERSRLRMVLAHERSHVRQMDFWMQLLAGIYTAVFWFSPLGWWLRRRLAALAEAISDRAGMEAAESGSDYARVVLEFAAMPRRRLPGVAMACSGSLSRRIDSLLNEARFRSAFAEGRRRAVASLLLIPAALFAATALIRVPAVVAQSAPARQGPQAAPAQAGPAAAPAGAGPAQTSATAAAPQTGQSFAGQGPNAGQVVRLAPTSPQMPPAPAMLAAPPSQGPLVLDVGPLPVVTIPNMKIAMPKIPDVKIAMPKIPDVNALLLSNLANGMSFVWPGDSFYLTPDGGMHGYAYYFSSNGDSWAIVDGAGKDFTLGSGADRDRLNRAQRMAKGPFLWFTHGGKSWIVEDPAIVARIRALYEPMKAIGSQQEALAVQQRVLGGMEEDLARQQRQTADVRVPNLSKQMADAEAALDSLKSEQGQMLSEEKLAEMEARLAEMEARLGSLQAQAATLNGFAGKMRELGDQERQLGNRQRELGDQQKKLAEQAQQQVQAIIQESLANGKARPIQ
jgi:hypothetical protein